MFSFFNKISNEDTIKIPCPSCNGKGYHEDCYGEYENHPARSCSFCGGNGEPIAKQSKEKVYYKGSYQNAVKNITNSSCKLGRGFIYAVVPKGQTYISKNQYEYLMSKLFKSDTIPKQETVCRELKNAGYVLHQITDVRGNVTYQ